VDVRLRNADLNLVLKDPLNPRSIVTLLNPKFEIRNPKLLNDFVRSHQHIRRNRQADLLGGLQIDDELELCRLLHRKIGWVGTF
jgi:hypothetical protein